MKRLHPYAPAYGQWPLHKSPILRWGLGLAAVGIIVVSMLQAPTRLALLSPVRSDAGVEREAALYSRNNAVEQMQVAMMLLAKVGPKRPNVDDPNRTGLIGVEWSDITSTLGDLEAKRTALSPLWAAAIVDELIAAGLKPGDTVAVSLSGSFPGLNIAVLAAAKALSLSVRAVVSPTASMYGANRPEWAWTDMMAALSTARWLQDVQWAVTLGAGDDMGKGLLSDNPAALQAIVKRSGAPLLKGTTLAEMIEARWNYYHADAAIKAFVNVGGGHAVMGDCAPPATWNGRIKRSWGCKNTPGLLWRFQQSGVPTLHFLNIKEMALRYGIPIDPTPLPGWNDASSSGNVNLIKDAATALGSREGRARP